MPSSRPHTARRTAAALVIGGAGFALLALSGCGKGAKVQSSDAQPVTVAKTLVRAVRPVVSLSGMIAPLQNVALTTDITEPTAAVYVNEGDSVRRGQVLAQLSTADLEANYVAAERAAAENKARLEQASYQAQAALESGNDQVRQAQAALDQASANQAYAQTELRRDEQLLGQGYVSQETVDQQRAQTVSAQQSADSAKAALATAIENQHVNGSQNVGLQKANVDAAQAAYASSVAQADSLATQIAKATIVSPIDGVVVNRNLNPGEYPGTRQIFTLQEVAHVYAELSAFGGQISSMRSGATVKLVSTALPEKQFAGTVVAVLSPTTPSSSGFIVKVDVPNPKGTLRPGMTVSAQVVTQAVTGVAVPVSSFLDDTHQTLMIVSGDTARVAQVQEVAHDAKFSVITGLSTGVPVVTNGELNLFDGQKVAVR
jgi:multidrug efflux pump subunit AcrA (membrane-fusion protein)